MLDTIFPRYCMSCEKEGTYVCVDCFETLDLSGVFDCPVCHAHTAGGEVCIPCRPNTFLHSHSAITVYKEDALIGKMMHAFKYMHVESLVDMFDIMIQIFLNDREYVYDYIVPVPLHRRRFVERGCNQAMILADIVSHYTAIPVLDILKRHKNTRQQATLSRIQRIENTTDAFVLKDNTCILDRRILLIDDVYTTGSTLNSCAKVLSLSGAKEVHSMSLARG